MPVKDTVSFRSSPAPSLRSTVPTPKSGWRTLTPGRISAGDPLGGAKGAVAAAGRGLQGGGRHLQPVARDLGQETARLAQTPLAEDLAALRPGEVQSLHGPRHPHVDQ